MRQIAFILIVACACFASYKITERSSQITVTDDSVTLPPLSQLKPNLIDFATLGHNSVYTDFWLIWTTQLINPLSPPIPLDDFLKLSQGLLIHQPKSERIYMAFCFYANEHFHRADLCESYSQLGLKLFPNSWSIALSQGYVYGFLLKDLARAAAFYQLAATRKDAPEYARLLSEKFRRHDAVTAEDYQIAAELLRRSTGKDSLDQSSPSKETP